MRRAVIVDGVRTPFVKALTDCTALDRIALGGHAARALVERAGLGARDVDAVVWGGVILPSAAPNVGREIAIDLGWSHAEAMTVTRACASGLQAVVSAAAMIERGDADVVLAGGADSTSNAEIKLPQKVVHALAPVALSGKAGLGDWAGVLPKLMPLSDIVPRRPKIAERSTGEVMGEAAEAMARRNGVSRESQDAFAVRSHHRAAAAIRSGRFEREVAPLGRTYADGLVRATTSVEQLARLRPAFAKDGSVTAGNASPLTDGAAAVLLMSEDAARALGHAPRARLRSWAFVGVDPRDQLLVGPALAIPRALDKAGVTLADVDLVDLHEAFAAQVLAVLKLMGSKAFAEARLGRSQAVGEVDPARLNVHGGSIALGHPFGATGARMVTTMANELVLADKQLAVLGICAAGGLGAAAVLERG
ncbi:MAG: acetyl-CoA C-acyltransferase [Deltaproteobacteria bacterium]|nr:acetyl-CoA C-acyltransferase [Deltaproteobacteria bacterium]